MRNPYTAAFRYLASQLSEVAPEQAMQLIRDFAREIRQSKSSGLFSISFFFAIWVSSGALSAAMNALDQIHNSPRKKARTFLESKINFYWLNNWQYSTSSTGIFLGIYQ
ncbi:MAG: YhjD/YihY/BrkB family envelope integrity protein [Potamolinea sp.]